VRHLLWVSSYDPHAIFSPTSCFSQLHFVSLISLALELASSGLPCSGIVFVLLRSCHAGFFAAVRAAASLPPPAPLLSTTTGLPGPARSAQPAASVATATARSPPPPAAAVRSRPARPLPPPPPPVLPGPARPPPPLVVDARPPPARPPPPPTGAACPGPARPPPPPAVAARPGPAPAPRCSDQLFMTARGGLDLGGDRTELVPRGKKSKNNVYGHDALGFSKADQRRLRRCVRFAIDDILGSARPLCLQDPERVRRAVVYL